MNKFLIGVAQLNSQDNVDENLATIENMVKEASLKGCRAIAFPEFSNYIGKEANKFAEEIPNGKTFNFMKELAIKYNIWINSGSIYEKSVDSRPYNTSFVVSPDGELAGKYRKIHLFDVTLKHGPDMKESNHIFKGDDLTVLDTKDLGVWGLSVCYDMRFPELYRILTLSGANILFVPANFTMNTGKDHWEPLLKARAIENGSYLVAPAQIGTKPSFQAYGKSMVIDPWGNIISQASNRVSLITAEIDLDYVGKIRNQAGTLQNRREDIYSIKKIK